MDFINAPQKYHNLRSDCCSYLKGDNGEPISVKMNNKSNEKRQLFIRLCLKTDRSKRHFFRLMQIDKRNHKQVKEDILLDVASYLEEIKLDFFGIQKATKEDSVKYIKDNFPGTQENDRILKQNASIVILQLVLFENNKQVNVLEYEINVGNPSSHEIKIKSYSPKTLSDGREITFCINNKIKDENKIPKLEISTTHQKFTITDQPAKNVFVYNLKGIFITKEGLKGRLCIDENTSEWVQFNIREKSTETLKRKCSSSEEHSPPSKIFICPSQLMSDTGSEKSSSTNKKNEISDKIMGRFLREIARVGHDYAFGRDLTDKAQKILNQFPIVSILQDDVGDTPLNNAILKGNEDRAFYLLEIVYQHFPKEINQVNTSGHTALILSPACNVSDAFVRKLIKYGADLMAQDNDGDNAFNIAIQYQRTDIFQVLVEEAKYQNVLCEMSPSLTKLVNDVLKQDYSDGFQILIQSFECIGNINEYESYIEEDYKTMYNFHLITSYITPLVEEDYTNAETNVPDILGLESLN